VNNPLDFSGKVALVTGAASGMGLATAQAFAEAGAAVVLADFREDAVKTSAQKLVESGHKAIALRCDVSDDAQVAAMVDRAVAEFDRLDAAFNNAGVMARIMPTAESTREEWDRVIGINLRGVWSCMKYELRQMVRQGSGAIVNNASVGALTGNPGIGSYIASKHGVVGLTRTAALEYIQHGIRVNAVNPGLIDTQIARDVVSGDEQAYADIAKSVPIGRAGTPTEIASVVLWLLQSGGELRGRSCHHRGRGNDYRALTVATSAFRAPRSTICSTRWLLAGLGGSTFYPPNNPPLLPEPQSACGNGRHHHCLGDSGRPGVSVELVHIADHKNASGNVNPAENHPYVSLGNHRSLPMQVECLLYVILLGYLLNYADARNSDLLQQDRRSHNRRRIKRELRPEFGIGECRAKLSGRFPDRVVQVRRTLADGAVKLSRNEPRLLFHEQRIFLPSLQECLLVGLVEREKVHQHDWAYFEGYLSFNRKRRV
jgi:NAD(P)-dependent dehydrogenase (short-subunit alcohol dehydrogenase family)